MPVLSSIAQCLARLFFPPGIFRRWSPDVNLYQFTTCFPTLCRAPRFCCSDNFAVIFFSHDAPFIIALCLVLVHLRRVYFGRFLRPPPIEVNGLSFRRKPSFLRLSPMGLDAYFNSTEIKNFSLSTIFLGKYHGRFWTSLILPTEIKCVSLVYIFLIKY